MRVVIAPDKFKGCLSARDVAAAIARGIGRAGATINIEQIPMADGGEGTVDALIAATCGRLITQRVTGPLPDMAVDAAFGILGDGQTAVIEMAAASGLHLLRPDRYDPMKTTTFGTGELLMAAAKLGVKRIILGIGGSATVDGGIGCAQACGVRFEVDRDVTVDATDRPLTGSAVMFADPSKEPKNLPARGMHGVEVVVASDVDHPLIGPRGAARVFGPQKGASAEQVEALDRALEHLSMRVPWGFDLRERPGAGAAGGLGFGMMAFFGAVLRPGFEIVAEAARLGERLAGTDLCITGEGRLDASSMGGKTAIGVARVCKKLGVPCVALVGAIGEGAEAGLAEGLKAYYSINDSAMSLEDAMRNARELLTRAAEKLMRSIGPLQ
jgi:glycerate kinase